MANESSTGPTARRRLLPWVLLAALWVAVLRLLVPVWTANPDYQYGLLLPLVALWLAWERWPDRPAPSPAARSRFPGSFLVLPPLGLAATVVTAFPDWRPALWLLALCVVALTLLTLRAWGGSATCRHFGFPAALVVAGLPWPTPVEAAVLQRLMHWNAEAVAQCLTLLGEPVLVRGNVLELARGWVGIDEACSGLRSLQGTLAAALVLGEWLRLPAGRRVLLVLAGVAAAVATNFARTLLLAWAGSRTGVASLERLHDPSGWLVLTVCIAVLWLVARAMRSRAPRGPAVVRPAASPRWPATHTVALAAAVVVATAGPAAWFAWRSAPPARPPAWLVDWNAPGRALEALAVRPAVPRVLGCDAIRAASWSAPDQHRWTLHWIRWDPRPAARAILAKYHTPEICLPAAGCTLRERGGIVTVETDAGPLAFRSYVFEESGRLLFVFHRVEEDRAGEPHAGLVEPLARERLRLVWEGRRATGQTALHVVLRGPADVAAAESALRNELPRVVRRAGGA